MKGTFVLCNEPDFDGRRVIYYRYYLYGSPIKRSTNIKVHPSEWDSDRQVITTPGADHLNRCLARLKRVADEALPAKASPVQIRNMFDTVFNRELYRAQNDDFLGYAYEVNIRRLYIGKLSKDTYNDNVGRIDAFARYLKQRRGIHFLALEDVDEDLLEDYAASLRLENEVIYKALTPLVSALESADEEGLIEHSILPSIHAFHLEFLNKDSKKAEKSFLTEEEIQTIKNYAETIPDGSTRDALDIFLFSFFCFGLRLQDIFLLKWEEATDIKVIKPKYKTARACPIELPLIPKAKEILNRWNGRNDRYVFDLVPANAVTDDAVHMKRLRHLKSQSISRIVSSVAAELCIKGRITMDTARRSFAHLALREGLSLYELSRILGYHSVDATIAYLGLNKETPSSMKKLKQIYDDYGE